MSHLGVYELVFMKTGLYSLTYTLGMKRGTPISISSQLDHLRVLMEQRIEREKNIGFRQTVMADLVSIKNKLLRTYGVKSICACENQLINIDKEFVNLFNYIKHVVEMRRPIFIDSDYFDESALSILYELCECQAGAPFLSLSQDMVFDDYLKNQLNVTLMSGGVVFVKGLFTNAEKISKLNDFFNRSFVSKLGEKLGPAVLIIGDNTSIRCDVMDRLLDHKDQLKLTIVATMRNKSLLRLVEIKDCEPNDFVGIFSRMM